jgi:hypothetical protein
MKRIDYINNKPRNKIQFCDKCGQPQCDCLVKEFCNRVWEQNKDKIMEIAREKIWEYQVYGGSVIPFENNEAFDNLVTKEVKNEQD